jgi:hypothetical protein
MPLLISFTRKMIKNKKIEFVKKFKVIRRAQIEL